MAARRAMPRHLGRYTRQVRGADRCAPGRSTAQAPAGGARCRRRERSQPARGTPARGRRAGRPCGSRGLEPLTAPAESTTVASVAELAREPRWSLPIRGRRTARDVVPHPDRPRHIDDDTRRVHQGTSGMGIGQLRDGQCAPTRRHAPAAHARTTNPCSPRDPPAPSEARRTHAVPERSPSHDPHTRLRPARHHRPRRRRALRAVGAGRPRRRGQPGGQRWRCPAPRCARPTSCATSGGASGARPTGRSR